MYQTPGAKSETAATNGRLCACTEHKPIHERANLYGCFGSEAFHQSFPAPISDCVRRFLAGESVLARRWEGCTMREPVKGEGLAVSDDNC